MLGRVFATSTLRADCDSACPSRRNRKRARQSKGPPVGMFLGPERIIAHIVSRGRFELCYLRALIACFRLAEGVADAAGAG